MTETVNLSDKIEGQLPPELVDFMKEAGGIAAVRGQNLYLVGGLVRDLLLSRTNLDLDLVVEGDAIELAQRLMQNRQGKITKHPHFKTAKFQWDKMSVDLTTARSETYARPGALPTVAPGSLKDDLFRRDFTINAMAVHLHPARYGELVDLYGGIDNLQHGLIRILHEKSFIDDATRIWRAIRYEQRLDFLIESTTLRLLKHNVDMLDTISADRIRYELECVLHEQRPEKALRRAEQLGVLQKLHPLLRGDQWLAKKFEKARQLSRSGQPTLTLYLALLCYRLSYEQIEDFIPRLRFPKSQARMLLDVASIKNRLTKLEQPNLPSSVIYRFLHEYSHTAILAVSIATDSTRVRQHLWLFLDILRYVRLALTGDDLKQMGVPPGPRMKELLQKLLEARLDEKVRNKQEEAELVKSWLASET